MQKYGSVFVHGRALVEVNHHAEYLQFPAFIGAKAFEHLHNLHRPNLLMILNGNLPNATVEAHKCCGKARFVYPCLLTQKKNLHDAQPAARPSLRLASFDGCGA